MKATDSVSLQGTTGGPLPTGSPPPAQLINPQAVELLKSLINPSGQDGANLPNTPTTADTPESSEALSLLKPQHNAAGSEGDEDNQKDSKGSSTSEEMTLGQAMLASLAQQSRPIENVKPTSEAASRQSHIESLVAETVTRVLVSDPLQGNRSEVRIQFAREVLPETEVRIWRADGRLNVEFTTPQRVADDGLQQALPRLAEALQRHPSVGEMPSVTLQTRDTTSSPSNASSLLGGSPQDGRSRGYYQPTQEEDEVR